MSQESVKTHDDGIWEYGITCVDNEYYTPYMKLLVWPPHDPNNPVAIKMRQDSFKKREVVDPSPAYLEACKKWPIKNPNSASTANTFVHSSESQTSVQKQGDTTSIS